MYLICFVVCIIIGKLKPILSVDWRATLLYTFYPSRPFHHFLKWEWDPQPFPYKTRTRLQTTDLKSESERDCRDVKGESFSCDSGFQQHSKLTLLLTLRLYTRYNWLEKLLYYLYMGGKNYLMFNYFVSSDLSLTLCMI